MKKEEKEEENENILPKLDIKNEYEKNHNDKFDDKNDYNEYNGEGRLNKIENLPS